MRSPSQAPVLVRTLMLVRALTTALVRATRRPEPESRAGRRPDCPALPPGGGRACRSPSPYRAAAAVARLPWPRVPRRRGPDAPRAPWHPVRQTPSRSLRAAPSGRRARQRSSRSAASARASRRRQQLLAHTGVRDWPTAANRSPAPAGPHRASLSDWSTTRHRRTSHSRPAAQARTRQAGRAGGHCPSCPVQCALRQSLFQLRLQPTAMLSSGGREEI